MRLFGKNVAIREVDAPAKPTSLIHTISESKSTPQHGVVVHASDTYVDHGAVHNNPLQPGDKVLFFKAAALEVELENEKLHLIAFDNVVAKV